MMKKLLALILALILAILLPAFALADWPAGTAWTHSSVSSKGIPFMQYLYLAEDGSCYYVIYQFLPDQDSLGRTYTGTWELLPSGNVYAKTGNKTSLELTFSNDQLKAMVEGDPRNFFYYVYTFDFN